MLYASVRQRKIYVKEPSTIIQNGVNVDNLILDMDDEWSEMTSIVCVFTNGSVSKQIGHTFGQPLLVPWETVAESGTLILSITGYVGTEKVMTTAKSDTGWAVVQNGDTSGGSTTEPTPDLLQQVAAAAAEATTAAQAATEAATAANAAKISLEESAENGDFDGETPSIGENGNWFIRETDTGKPSRGVQGETGVIFTPHLSEDGVLSWTNDGGLPNPDPASLLGSAGGVTSFKGRSGAVVPSGGDYTAEMVGAEKANAVSEHNSATDAHDTLFANKLDKDGDSGTTKPTFTQSAARTQMESGLELNVLLGRIMKWFADLGTAAFQSSDNFESKGAGDTAVTSHNASATAHANQFALKSGKGITFTLTLQVGGWSNSEQTLEDSRFLESGYVYVVSPADSNRTAFGNANIRVSDITENGKLTFSCTTTPTTEISVKIYRAEVAS